LLPFLKIIRNYNWIINFPSYSPHYCKIIYKIILYNSKLSVILPQSGN
jgi:hypothetical protein